MLRRNLHMYNVRADFHASIMYIHEISVEKYWYHASFVCVCFSKGGGGGGGGGGVGEKQLVFVSKKYRYFRMTTHTTFMLYTLIQLVAHCHTHIRIACHASVTKATAN